VTDDLTALSDGELVLRAQPGDAAAFGELVRRYEGRIYHLVRRILSDPQEAEDALQETFLSAWRGLPRFKREARFSTWIFRIATNAALMRLRRRRPDTVSLDAPVEGDGATAGPSHQVVDWGPTPEQAAVDDETRAAMEAAIAALPPELRAVFLLRDVEEMSNQEVAEAIDLTVPAVKSRLHRARLFLRERLNQHYAGRASPGRGALRPGG
jgi:RNA polymerase sigma-70 factor (ECF subfamily)